MHLQLGASYHHGKHDSNVGGLASIDIARKPLALSKLMPYTCWLLPDQAVDCILSFVPRRDSRFNI